MVSGLVTIGARLEKLKTHPWPAVYWAVVDGREVLAHATSLAPKTYSEAAALLHVYEAIEGAVRESKVKRGMVWTIETNAKLSTAMRPRLHVEGVVAAAVAGGGGKAQLVAWAEVAGGAGVPPDSKERFAKATKINGIDVNGADSHAVLAAIAAQADGTWT